MTPGGAVNPTTGTRYPVEEGIPRLFVPTDGATNGRDVTELVKQFYEQTPFPNYDDLDTPRALLEKARAGRFARLLNEQIPYDARVVEIGCGTGQLTNFLAIAHRTVLGVDVCLNSLRLAQGFKMRHGLDRATFAQMNLFRPGLKDGFFDVVISNGVLHHTATAAEPSAASVSWSRPGGYLVVGLYNAYSRKLHYARRALFRWTGLHRSLARSALRPDGRRGQARGLVPGSVLPPARDVPHAGRGPRLDGRVRAGVHELDPEAGAGPGAGRGRAALRAPSPRATP